MKWLLSICLFFGAGISFAQQPGFSKIYKAGTFGCKFAAVEPCNEGMMVAAYALDSTDPVHTGIKFLRLNAAGDIQAGSFFTLPDDSLWVWYRGKALTRLNDNCYAAVVNVEKITGERTWIAVMADSNGQVVRYRHLPLPQCSGATFMTIMDVTYDPANNALLAFGLVSCPDSRWVLVKLDTLLQVQWSKLYGTGNYRNYAKGILNEGDGYSMYGMIMNSASSNSPGLVNRSMIIKVDTAGNELWTYLSPAGQLNGAIQDLTRTPDGGYAYVSPGDVVNYAPSNYPVADWRGRGTLVKLNASRQQEWMVAYPAHRPGWSGDGYAQRILLTDDQSLLIAGSWSDSLNWNQVNTYGGVRKYLMNGAFVWERKYKVTDTLPWNMESYIFNDAYSKAGGGFLFAGTFQNGTYGWTSDASVYGWLVSTDSNGCRYANDSLCQGTAVEEIHAAGKQLSIYPNPAQQTVTIKYAGYPDEIFDIRFTNVQGMPVKELKLAKGNSMVDMDISAWPPGIYLYTCRFKDGEISAGKFIKL